MTTPFFCLMFFFIRLVCFLVGIFICFILWISGVTVRNSVMIKGNGFLKSARIKQVWWFFSWKQQAFQSLERAPVILSTVHKPKLLFNFKTFYLVNAAIKRLHLFSYHLFWSLLNFNSQSRRHSSKCRLHVSVQLPWKWENPANGYRECRLTFLIYPITRHIITQRLGNSLSHYLPFFA